jgi:hypothetical protein
MNEDMEDIEGHGKEPSKAQNESLGDEERTEL